MELKQKITFEERCTCGIEDGDEDHTDACELHNCDAWFAGEATWYNGELWDNEELWGWSDAEPLEEVGLVVKDENPDDFDYQCTCFPIDDPTVTFSSKHQATCELSDHDAWIAGECEWNHQTRSFVYYPSKQSTSKSSTSYGYSGGWGDYGAGGWGAKSCTHDGTVPVTFPNGVKVYPSSSHDTKKRESYPDHALYLETSRMPSSIATYIPWRDYGLPTVSFHHAADTIIECYRLAENGMTLEVGCIGAHGRTGTALACMAVLAGVPVDEAVDWVQANHCKSAVESDNQRWFVAWFHAYVNGIEAPPVPPKPEPKPITKSTSTYSAPKQGAVLPFTPAPSAKVGDTNGDLRLGDPCPACKFPLVRYGQKLACNSKGCKNYDGLATCPDCGVCLDAQPVGNYLCWNVHCTSFNVLSKSPAASPAAKKKGVFKKGRKKHR